MLVVSFFNFLMWYFSIKAWKSVTGVFMLFVYDVGYNTRMIIAESFCRICTLVNYHLLFL